VSAQGDKKLSKTNYSWIKKISAYHCNLEALGRVSASRPPSQHAQPGLEYEEHAFFEEI
jgi:hypothetical protein